MVTEGHHQLPPVVLTEKLDPPANVTVHCNVSHCHVRWHQPRTWHRFTHQDFQYQLDIQRQVRGHGKGPWPSLWGGTKGNVQRPKRERDRGIQTDRGHCLQDRGDWKIK